MHMHAYTVCTCVCVASLIYCISEALVAAGVHSNRSACFVGGDVRTNEQVYSNVASNKSHILNLLLISFPKQLFLCTK